jgi:transcriptional regulator with PAS, ATPase and Fis domain
MVGESSALAELRRQIVRVAGSDVPVCLLGESGAGKELAARSLHLRSGRRGKFVAINCAAIPSTLQDAELFGYELRMGRYSSTRSARWRLRRRRCSCARCRSAWCGASAVCSTFK